MTGSSRADLQTVFLLRAAQGWLELGLPEEAWKELQQIRPQDCKRQEVMLLRLDTLQTLRRWEECSRLGEEILERFPACGPAYLVTAYAIRRSRSLREAREILLRGESALLEDAMFHFNLACYACQLGEFDEAQRRLTVAFRLDAKFRAVALNDEDLEAMRPWIKGFKA